VASMPDEQWRSVPGYPDYEVSNLGFVRSWKSGAARIMSRRPDGKGYPRVGLSTNGVVTERNIHQLVVEAFVGPRPDGMEVRHLDGDPMNCTLPNLEYATHAINMADTVRHGTNHYARRTHCDRGHRYTRENTQLRKQGRRCRICKRAQDRREYAARKLARN
jgi:hypothetical protein